MKIVGKNRRAFTLVEIMIVVAVVGLLATMSIPSMVKARRVSQTAVLFSDMKTAAAAFEIYAMENGNFPVNGAPGVVPAGMADYLGDFPWTEKNSVKGSWNWDFDRYGFTAAVSVTQHEADPISILDLDERVDDGSLDTGVLRRRPGGYSYIIE